MDKNETNQSSFANSNSEINGKVGFERLSTKEYTDSLASLQNMRDSFKELKDYSESKKHRVKAFFEKYAELMSSDIYRQDDPQPFLDAASRIIKEGEELLISLGN